MVRPSLKAVGSVKSASIATAHVTGSTKTVLDPAAAEMDAAAQSEMEKAEQIIQEPTPEYPPAGKCSLTRFVHCRI